MIRLSRIGRKKHPHYRLVIAEKARDTYGRTLEILGHYHPLKEDGKDKLILNSERITHWISNGAQTSNTVNNLLIEAGIIKGDKKRTIGTYKSKKAEEDKPEEKAEAAVADKPVETPKEEVKEEAPAKAPKAEEKKEEAKAEEKPAEEEEEKA